jgi:hypothetical protein
MSQIENFWYWFNDNKHRLRRAEDDWLVLDLILAKLKEINAGLFFEMSLDAQPKKFIISASGKIELFGLVDEIIARAPKFDDWKFVSLKPPKGFNFTSTFRGLSFNPQKMWFLPLKKREDPKFLGLRIGFEGGCNFAEKQMVRDGTFLVLDTGLGERVAATRIQYLEINELPTDPCVHGYGKLTELPKYFSDLDSTHGVRLKP